MYLGIDLGTSSVKAVLVEDAGAIIASANAPLDVSRPYPLWSEQDTADWWAAATSAVIALPAHLRAEVRSIGLSGQMHGAVLLDDAHNVLRSAILWNDGRSCDECGDLEGALPTLVAITGNHAMAGFTSPKLLWVAKHEPETFAKIKLVLLPKDWLRLRMTGQAVSEMSDAAGTLWLDTGKRCWSEAALAATGLTKANMPRLVEGSTISARLSPQTATVWGLPSGIPVAGGAGDNAASAVGMGLFAPGQGFVSLGTSGVIFVTADAFAPNAAQGVHTFCHAIPNQWHWMSVILSASSAIDWAVKTAGFIDITEAIAAVSSEAEGDVPVFLPYLSGERTPHNDPQAKGAYFGLSHATTRTDLVRAALEGVAFAFGDGLEALKAVGTMPDAFVCVGGGARIMPLLPILASVLNKTLHLVDGSDAAAAIGAARLGRLALTGEDPASAFPPHSIRESVNPDPDLALKLGPRRAMYTRLYPILRQSLQEFPT
jgi:xylulokinase